MGYTEASNAIPPGGSRPDSSVSSEAAGAAVATERFGHADRMKDHRILVVDDEPASRKGLQELLTVWGYDVSAAGDGQEALERAAARVPDLVIADLVMPGIDGLELLSRLKRDFPTTAVVFLTGQGSIETAVQAIKDGAYDYLTKPVDPTRLQILLDRALERSETAREVQLLRRQLRQRGAFGRLLGSSRGMMEVMRQVEVSAPTDATLFIAGESGTGKELVARTVHELSPRRRGPFVAVNCAAIPETLLESEIFGHERGSFTGAVERRQGCFELADGGTLFLDEVAEMQPGTQAKFLRVLQEGQFRRLGAKAEIRVNVRVVAATNKEPVKALQDGTLREDLYYRLNVFAIALPPLRDRLEDLSDLAQAFVEEFNDRHGRNVRGVDETALDVLRRHRWPGNVRELRNVIERAVIICSGDLVRAEHLPIPGHDPGASRRGQRRRSGAPDRHDRRGRREGADPADPEANGRQQDPRRRDSRHQPQDTSQQAPQIQRLTRMRLTLRARQVLALAFVVLLVVVASTVAHLANVARLALGSAADEGELMARQLYHQSSRVVAASPKPSPALLQQDPGIRALLEGMIGYSRTVVYAAVVDPSDRVLAHSNPKLEGEILPPRESVERLKTRSTVGIVASLFGQPEVYEAQVPMRLGERPFGTVRVGVSTSLLKQELAQAALYSLAVALAALGIAVAVGLVVGHLLLQSLRKISNGMDRLARGEYGATVDLTRDDELGELAARVNQLGERVHAEQSHWQNDRARMEGILDSLEDAVIVLNAKREVVFCNQAGEGLLGQSLDSPEGALAGLLPADHPLGPVVTELFDAGIERRNSAVKVRCPDGQSRELAVSSYRIPDGERAGGGVLALRNLEPVRAVQSLVTYSQKLAALGRLTSGVAHEVKNPLNAMRIHLELLKARLGASQPPIRENLDVIAQEIVRLDRVVQGFLKFVRPEEIRLAPVQVDALLSEIARLMVPEAAHAGARITEDVAPELPPVAGDRELLQQALTNLVTNAIQAMPKGGTVTLGARLGPDGSVEIRIADEGVGIPAQDLEKIFRLYFTTKSQGSGIGLSMVYRIVQMHDGRIDVESEVDRGTVMILTLPVASGSVQM
jgi:DNA-binding NtrC family response regulator/signal transduction histidine kinase/HAMP domain-containing protein